MLRVAEERSRRGLTQEELADLAGIDRTHVGLLERRQRRPSLAVALKITEALGFSLPALLQDVMEGAPASAPAGPPAAPRRAQREFCRNEAALQAMTGLTCVMLCDAITSCYETLDHIDEQLIAKGSPPLSAVVELANLSSMVGNILGAAIANKSEGLYARNGPHKYPDLLPLKPPARELELKIALETNYPKGHLPKPGAHVFFRYVLGDRDGGYSRDRRGDTVWIWEAKIGDLTDKDFSISNTPGDSGKTAVVKTAVFHALPLVYFNQAQLPYKCGAEKPYRGFN